MIPNIGSNATAMFDGVEQLTPEERRKELGGESIADRGLRAEAEIVARTKLKDRTPTTKIVDVDTTVLTPKRGRGRPRKTPTPITELELRPRQDAKVHIELDFMKEICATWSQYFTLLEQLSSSNVRITSPGNGGIDLEYGYAMRDKLRKLGLVSQ